MRLGMPATKRARKRAFSTSSADPLLIPASIDAELPSACSLGLASCCVVMMWKPKSYRVPVRSFLLPPYQLPARRPGLPVVAVTRRKWAARPEAIPRQRRGNLSASFENSGSVIRATTESHVAITDAERGAWGSTKAISPKCSPAMRRSTNSPLTSTENSPLRIRKRSLSEAPWWISVLPEGTASRLTCRANSSARSWSRMTLCILRTFASRGFPSGP